jgi:hypothetical protein
MREAITRSFFLSKIIALFMKTVALSAFEIYP